MSMCKTGAGRRAAWVACVLALLVGAVLLSGCQTSVPPYTEQMVTQCEQLTGTWICHDPYTQTPTDTYLVFDGARGAMRFSYYEGDELVREGSFRVVYRGEGRAVKTPLDIGFSIEGKGELDWLSCYVDDFKEAPTQFTVMRQTRGTAMDDDGPARDHYVYRMSELPLGFGTYVKEGATLTEERGLCYYADTYLVPSGVYGHEGGAQMTFLGTYYVYGNMLRIEQDGRSVDAVYTLSADSTKLFVWIDRAPGTRPTREEREAYGMQSGEEFPPSYVLFGTFLVGEEHPTVTVERVHAVEGYGYDPTVCSFAVGTYTRTP